MSDIFYAPDTEYTLDLLEENTQVGLESIPYPVFFRSRGIRRIDNFSTPKFSKLDTFQLPLGSIAHYLSEGNVELGPAPTDVYFRSAPALILAQNITTLSSTIGTPIRTPAVTPDRLEQDYRAQYRRIRPLKNVETGLRDDRTIVVINYAMLTRLYRYRPLPFTRLFMFQNMLNTWIDQVNHLAKISTRQQWIKFKLPKRLPNKAELVRGAMALNRQTLQYFSDDTALFLLELWKWLGPRRETSLLARLTPEAIERLNFLAVEQNYYTFFNLGLLEESRVDPSDTKKSGKAPAQMQLYLLRFLDSLFTIRSVAAKTTVETISEEEDENTALLDAGKPTDDDDRPVTELPKLPEATSETNSVVVVDDSDDDNDTVVAINKDGEELLLLEQLEAEAAAALVNNEFTDIQTQFIATPDPTETVEPPEDLGPTTIFTGVTEAAETLHRNALISHAELKRYQRLAQSCSTIPNPFGEGTLLDLATPDPEITGTLEETPIVDMPWVTDKSMLKSTLIKFDSDYINKVLHKDVAAFILAAQKVGVAVTSFNVTPYVDANNKFDIYEIKFVPVGGAPSTFRFRLPRVDSDGIWTANGVKYRLRKQHRD